MPDQSAPRGLIPRILSTWRWPGAAVRSVVAMSEPAILALLLGTMAVYFIAQWPAHAREAAIDPSVPLQARVGGALLATLFLLPLILMAVGQLVGVILRLAGFPISGRQSRLALVWALAAVAPIMLLSGLVQGFVGPGPGLALVQAVAGVAFFIFWIAGLRELVKMGRQE